MTWPAVLFPPADTVVIAALHLALTARADTATVVSFVPDQRPDRFVVIRRTGGPRRDPIVDNAQITIDCWDATDVDAHDLAQLVRALIGAMPGHTYNGVAVYRVTEASGPALLPEPNTALPRYTFTVQIAMRGTAVA